MNDEAAGFVGFQPYREGVTVGNHRLPSYRKSRSLSPNCRRMAWSKPGAISARRSLSTALEYGRPFAVIDGAVAALAALLRKPDDDPTLAAEPPEAAQQLVSGHGQGDMTFPSCRQADVGRDIRVARAGVLDRELPYVLHRG